MPRTTLVALATCTSLVLAACGGPELAVGGPAPSPVTSWGTGAPTGADEGAIDVADPSGGAARVAASLTSMDQLLVTTWGSSSCPRLPESVVAEGSSVVVGTKEFNLFGGSGCTADASPTTSSVPVPAGITVAGSLRVVVDGTTVQATKP